MNQKNLLRNEKIVKILFETTPDMLAILDRDGKILDCNNHYIKNFGYTKDELLTMNGPVDMVSDKDRQKAIAALGQVVINGIKLNVQLEVVRKDKSTFPSIWSGAAMYDESGNLEGYLVTGKDLTDIFELKNEISKIKQEGQKEKMVLLGLVASRIAHDIKNPLSTMKLTVDILSKRPDSRISDYSIQEKIRLLSDSIDRISNQVNYVLDYIKERPVRHEKIVLSSCVLDSIKNIHVPSNVEIIVDDSELSILGDLFQLQVVCTNLLLNAIQSFEKNPGHINVRFSEEQDYIVITVQDSGPGIPEDILPEIFDPLVTTKQAGTGLGLVSCKSIIEAHGGKIYAKNNPTTFTIKIPKSSDIK